MRSHNLLYLACLKLLITPYLTSEVYASQSPDYQDKTIKIGLLIPDDKSVAARRGAEMAIREANTLEGFAGLRFQLVTRSMEGPWGTGSKEAVNLVFEEKVWAILGSHGGRNAHLVEQVAAKVQVVFISAWATDPTLSRAFIPWYFSCVPDDIQQADALIEEIYNKRRFEKPVVVNGNDYDSKMSSETFLKRTKLAGKADPLRFSLDNSSQDFGALLDKINKADVSCIILYVQPQASLKLIQQIRIRNMKQPLFGSLQVLNEDGLSFQELLDYDDIILIPAGYWPLSENSSFYQEFHKTYNSMPGVVASYAYDGMKLIIEAIKKAGTPDREKIQEAFETINYEGVTGLIQFDIKGNRRGDYKLTGIKNGLPVLIE